jgi:hypothetical protein
MKGSSDRFPSSDMSRRVEQTRVGKGRDEQRRLEKSREERERDREGERGRETRVERR